MSARLGVTNRGRRTGSLGGANHRFRWLFAPLARARHPRTAPIVPEPGHGLAEDEPLLPPRKP